jgi:hypothetical protein
VFRLFQEQTGKQLGTLERSPSVSSGTHRVGHPQGYGTHWTGAHWWRRSLSAKTTGTVDTSAVTAERYPGFNVG